MFNDNCGRFNLKFAPQKVAVHNFTFHARTQTFSSFLNVNFDQEKSQDNRCRNVFLNSSLKKRRRRRKFSFAKAGCVFSTVASRYLRSKTRSPLRWFTCSLRCELFFSLFSFFYLITRESSNRCNIYSQLSNRIPSENFTNKNSPQTFASDM